MQKNILVILLLFILVSFTAKHEFDKRNQDEGLSVDAFKQKVNNQQKIVLVYLHADWCAPCVKLKPIIEQIETEENVKVEVLKIDTDKNPKIAQHFEINTLPYFIIYKKGQKVWEKNMAMEKSDLVARLHFYTEEKK